MLILMYHNSKTDSKLIASTLYPDAVRAYSGFRQYSNFEKVKSVILGGNDYANNSII